MPVAFAGNGPEVYGAKVINEVHLRDHIAALVQEVLKLVFVAPVIDGRFSIAGDPADQQRIKHIRVLLEKIGVILMHILPYHGNGRIRQVRAGVFGVPASCRLIVFGKLLPIGKVSLYVCF